MAVAWKRVRWLAALLVAGLMTGAPPRCRPPSNISGSQDPGALPHGQKRYVDDGRCPGRSGEADWDRRGREEEYPAPGGVRAASTMRRRWLNFTGKEPGRSPRLFLWLHADGVARTCIPGTAPSPPSGCGRSRTSPPW